MTGAIAVLLVVAIGVGALDMMSRSAPPVVLPGGSGSSLSFGAMNGSGGEIPATQELKKFASADELSAFLTASSSLSYGGSSRMQTLISDSAFSSKSASIAGAAEGAAPSAAPSATDYSQTNVQVAGVDEADFVKNDGRYIYLVADNNRQVLIIDALNASAASVISTINIGGDSANYDYYAPQAKELFVNGDKLAVFTESSELAFYVEKYDIVPQQTYSQRTTVRLYDISDRSDPKEIGNYSVSGSYYQSRLIGDFIYLVTQDQPYYQHIMPPIVFAKGVSVTPDVYYFDNPEDSYQFNTITSIDMANNRLGESKSFLLGYANTLMVSENNIYIAYQKQQSWCRIWWGCWRQTPYDKERFYGVVVPLLKGDIKTKIDAIIAQNLPEDEAWQKISAELSDFYKQVQSDDALQSQYQEMFTNITDALQQYDLDKVLQQGGTVVHKIGISGGKIEYKAKGEVVGQLLNQFSMDEYQGKLRLATTFSTWLREQVQFSNVYVLDENMNTVGRLENISRGESIYAARFIGDRLYLVTFRRIDPLFVIDLSDATAPKILGELKIPGYSDYLHPYDETHIIGVGKETGDNEWGGTSVKGLKVALFDVSDVANPKVTDSVEIGTSGTDSAALYDHRAFLFSKSKGLLVLPVSEVVGKTKTSDYGYSYDTWHGAYAWKVDTAGFTLLGKVEHSSSTDSYFNWWNEATVSRSLYMDDALYTISNKYVKANDLANGLAPLSTIRLPNQQNGYPYPMPLVSRGSASGGVMVN